MMSRTSSAFFPASVASENDITVFHWSHIYMASGGRHWFLPYSIDQPTFVRGFYEWIDCSPNCMEQPLHCGDGAGLRGHLNKQAYSALGDWVVQHLIQKSRPTADNRWYQSAWMSWHVWWILNRRLLSFSLSVVLFLSSHHGSDSNGLECLP